MTSILKEGKHFFTKNEFSHEGAKAQKKNAQHFFLIRVFVPSWQPFFAAKRRKNTSYCHYKRA